ncbi:MAG: Uma2 family endonuclease [Planctomycetaceae bacterium]
MAVSQDYDRCPRTAGVNSVDEEVLYRRSSCGEPTWEVAYYYPFQGHWTEEEFLHLDRMGNRLIELSDGCIELLPRPTWEHRDLLVFMLDRLDAHVRECRLGEVLMAPLPVRLGQDWYRTPDVMFFRPGRITNRHGQPEGADLVVEIVGPSDEERCRDLITKRQEYARAAIPEYWIVDPETRTIHVLTLDGVEAGGPYRVHGEFNSGETASSALLEGFTVSIDDCFAAGDGTAGDVNAPEGDG